MENDVSQNNVLFAKLQRGGIRRVSYGPVVLMVNDSPIL